MFKLLLLFYMVYFVALPVNACGGCQPSAFSLFYNYVVPSKIKTYTNPYFQAKNAVNTIRNPRSILSPCNPVNGYLPNSVRYTTAAVYSIPNLNTQNVFGSLGSPNSGNSQLGSSQNAYVSSYALENSIQSPGSSNLQEGQEVSGYYDGEKYVWVLPDGSLITNEAD